MRVESEALRQGLQERPHGEGSRVGEGCGRQVNPNPNPDPIRNPKPNRARGVEPLARVIGIGIGIALGLGLVTCDWPRSGMWPNRVVILVSGKAESPRLGVAALCSGSGPLGRPGPHGLRRPPTYTRMAACMQTPQAHRLLSLVGAARAARRRRWRAARRG